MAAITTTQATINEIITSDSTLIYEVTLTLPAEGFTPASTTNYFYEVTFTGATSGTYTHLNKQTGEGTAITSVDPYVVEIPQDTTFEGAVTAAAKVFYHK